MTIVDEARLVTGGVDTHADTHVAAALDGIGGLLGVREFAATQAGYARLLGWLQGFGAVGLAGIEGTGSYVTALGWPGRSPRPGSGSSRSTARTGRTGAARASRIRWTRSVPRGQPCRAAHPGRRAAGTARSRRSGR